MSASKYTMPIIVLNIGGEMIYILNQRLHAQNVSEDKAKKVLFDVVRAMFSPIFIEELFKPQDMYSIPSTKQIFEKLAHSSIMRLNKSSMDKLFDLMMMGFKYQCLQCNSPQQFVHMSFKHLDVIKKLVDNEAAFAMVQVAIDNLISTYSNFTQGQFYLLKQSIFRYFQGKKIKVSLFLQHNIQGNDGTIMLNMGKKLPFGTDSPGIISTMEGGKAQSRSHFESGDHRAFEAASDIIDYRSELGTNMYVKNFAPEMFDATDTELASSAELSRLLYNSWGASSTGSTSSSSGGGGVRPSSYQSSASSASRSIPAKRASAKAETTMLADLLGLGGGGGSKDEPSDGKGFRINLFPDGGFKDSDGDKGDGLIHLDIDATADAKTMSSYLEELDLNDDDAADGKRSQAKGGGGGGGNDANAGSDDDDDLLALMDSAK